jgi:protein-S-isoprenylcysteine O-methyltransferase Ste14
VSASDDDAIVRLGGWLFKQRSWLPLPIVAGLLVLPHAQRPPTFIWSGVACVVLGEAIRLWAVNHIGVISRTRSDRLGPLVDSGPFGYVRNPLYLGNIALWLGFTISAGLLWLAPVVAAVLAMEYHAIVRWEEGLLARRLGDAYRAYMVRVPRWLPSPMRPAAPPRPPQSTPASEPTRHAVAAFSWRETFFSERSTLAAVAGGYLILWIKA